MRAPIRACAVVGTAVLASVLLSACSPPNQVDSDLKIPTATGRTISPAVTGDSIPGFIDCVSAPVRAPESLSLTCTDTDDRLTAIMWTSWDQDHAEGTGTRTLIDATGTETTTADVAVELSEPTETSQGLVFSRVSINDEVIAL
ncbi:hypothetical protein [Corynebacterium pacaense]|uniref:hypothetical protein n=1 Tax=Corynebacterium pacaense TaxID=1816684 RepID=UPI0009B9E99B|nr:hypothetical protein [Corynebacterium pacaense]